MDLMGLMKGAAAMQERARALQEEMEALTVDGEAGGGLVRATLSAKGALRALAIDPSLLRPEDAGVVADLVVAAHADARAKADRLVEERMRDLTAGLPLPPGLKLPF